MTCDDIRDRIDDYVGGRLSDAARAAMAAHLAGCPECTADLAAAEALAGPVAAATRSIAPPRDLWPAVAARIAPRRRSHRPAVFAAAAIILMAISSAATALLLRDDGPEPVAIGAPIPPAALEAEYVRRAGVLARLVEQDRAMLAPATVATLERNLEVIDRAIEESRAALAADPASRELEMLLRATHEQKVELLERVTRLVARS
jgi:anti-sigma factor RsiW